MNKIGDVPKKVITEFLGHCRETTRFWTTPGPLVPYWPIFAILDHFRSLWTTLTNNWVSQHGPQIFVSNFLGHPVILLN